MTQPSDPPLAPVVSMHRLDEDNVGDYWSSPLRYFDLPIAQVLDIDEPGMLTAKTDNAAAIVVGGGGLLKHRQDWDKVLAAVADDPRPAIAWGVGLGAVLRPFTARQHLDHWKRRALSVLDGDLLGRVEEPDPTLPEYLERFDLVGVRDDLPEDDTRWVPCVSCMHPAFSEKMAVTREVAVLEHKGVPIKLDCPLPDDVRMQNSGNDIGSLVTFIASCEVLVTSTYHGAYWGTLLGKRVIVYHPFSIKFRYMRHPPTVYSGDLAADIRRSRAYPKALEDCREANGCFHEDVCKMLQRHATRIDRT